MNVDAGQLFSYLVSIAGGQQELLYPKLTALHKVFDAVPSHEAAAALHRQRRIDQRAAGEVVTLDHVSAGGQRVQFAPMLHRGVDVADAEMLARLESLTLEMSKVFDERPTAVFAEYVILACRFFKLELAAYLERWGVAATAQAVRLRRIELLSARLHGGREAPLPSSAAPALTQRPGGDEDSVPIPDAETELTAGELQRVTPAVPERTIYIEEEFMSTMFSLYLTCSTTSDIPLVALKTTAKDIENMLLSLTNCSCASVTVVEQLRRDRSEQARTLLSQWVEKGKGRLEPVMLPPPEAADAETDAQAMPCAGGSDGASGRSPFMSAGSFKSMMKGETERAVDAAVAEEMVREHMSSRRPCCSRLADEVAATVPGMDGAALLPCIEQPDRRGFEDGYIRLAPYMTEAEEELLTTWMQVRLTEIGEDCTPEAETALVRAWASPTYDARGGELTVLVNPTNAFRMQLSNPSVFCASGLQCDMCCLGGRTVVYQAVLDSNVRNQVVRQYEGCNGFDVCIACSYYYYKACEVRLLRAVHPDAAVRRPFAYGRHSRVAVQSLRVVAAGPAEAVVEAVVGVAPFGVLPVGWVLPREGLARLQRACALTGDADDYVELTAEQHAAMPVPDARWAERCRVTNVSKRLLEAAAASAEDDVCPICLQPLHGALPVLRTLCGHWFHVECVGSHYHYKPAVVDGEVNEANGCPVCRHTEYMPSLTDVEETLRTNVYRLELRVAAAELPCAVALGTLLTDDGAYHNATNIAACTSFHDLKVGYVYGECSPSASGVHLADMDTSPS